MLGLSQKKGGIKVHSVVHANEGVPCDIQFTSAAKHDHLTVVCVKSSLDDPRYIIFCMFDTTETRLYVVDTHL